MISPTPSASDHEPLSVIRRALAAIVRLSVTAYTTLKDFFRHTFRPSAEERLAATHSRRERRRLQKELRKAAIESAKQNRHVA